MDFGAYRKTRNARKFLSRSVGDFAELNYSKEYVSRTFRKVTGKTLTDYMNQRKLSLASVLIQNTDKSIDRICFECGYNNVSYFTERSNKPSEKLRTN